jgi:hypothetical protein
VVTTRSLSIMSLLFLQVCLTICFLFPLKMNVSSLTTLSVGLGIGIYPLMASLYDGITNMFIGVFTCYLGGSSYVTFVFS